MKVVRRCVCRGAIEADPEAPGPAVLAHGRSAQHEAWRLGYRVEGVRSDLPCPDGKPVVRLVRIA